MEVFMRNVPVHLTNQTISTHLKDKIKSIGINDWTCQKRPGKNFGTLTFHARVEGSKFLRQYGEVAVPGAPTRNGKPRTKGRLSLLGNTIYCTESKHAPEPLALKVLDRQVEEREETKHLDKEVSTNATMALTAVSCGHYDYPDGKVTFMVDMKIKCTGIIKFAKNLLIVTYRELDITYRVEIPYRIIYEVVASTEPRSLLVTLWESPRFFSQEGDQSQSQFGITRKRITGLPHYGCDHSRFVGQSLVYQFSTSSTDLHHKMRKIAEDKSLFCTSYKRFATLKSPVSMVEAMAALNQTFSQIDTQVPFDVAYQFHGLARGGYILPLTVRSLLIRLQKYSVNAAQLARSPNVRSFCPFSAAAVKKLFLIEFAGPGTEGASFQVDILWNRLLENEHAVRVDLSRELISARASKATVSVYKVQVTPTRVLFSGPELEPNNRVLRKFENHTEYFARVQLCEEDGQDMFFNPRIEMEVIWDKYKEVLAKGIQICGRIYKFLGFSHSSLRAHAVWAMAPFFDSRIGKLREYLNVIPELGVFDKIMAPARRAARIGQAFSDTRFMVSLENVTVQFIPDVKSADGSRVFSDGVGTISRAFLEVIREALPERMKSATCFQIRWAGAKGMLSLDDALPGLVMRIRKESMVKFESNDTETLEICDAASKPTPLVLNRQMIKILEDMGVPIWWFLEKQAIEVSRLRKITADVNNTATFLRRQKIGDQMRFSGFLKKLHQIGLDYKTDRFLCTIIEAVVLRELRLLKNKARIPVERGVTLFGVMDEFNFLKEDEVFVAFDNLEGNHYLDLHETTCIVTRSPALHPGDIQLCRNIVPPDNHPLRSLKNCIVFNQRGARDLPSQLSGGDLDGDIFSVVWDEVPVSSCVRIWEPADYPKVTPLALDRKVEVEDMIDFLVMFMATDQLGLIANRHLIYADQLDGGASDPICTKLAELHSTAVDYSKTGVPVNMQDLRGNLSAPRYRPDFMSPIPPANLKDHSEIEFEAQLLPPDEVDEDDRTGPRFLFYKSERALGHLFRNIDERKIWHEDIQMFDRREGQTLWGQLLHFIKRSCVEHHLGDVKWREALDEAGVILDTYNAALEGLTIDYSENSGEPITEVEIFTGSIFNSRGLPTKRQGERSLQLKDEFDRVTRWIESLIRQHKMQDHIEEGHYNEPSRVPNGSVFSDEEVPLEHSTTTPLELSIACLHVALTKKTHASQRSRRSIAGGKFESFKVIAASCALRELERTVQRQKSTTWLS